MKRKQILLRIGESAFGTAEAAVIKSWEEAALGWIFPNVPGGLAHYRSQLPDNTSPPIMIFDDITVFESFQKQGLGSAGMLATMRRFRKDGAQVAFLRIGTQGEPWSTGKVWRQRMYEKLGWAVLDNHPDNEGDVPIMWHPMTGDLSCPRLDDIELELVDDDPYSAYTIIDA